MAEKHYCPYKDCFTCPYRDCIYDLKFSDDKKVLDRTIRTEKEEKLSYKELYEKSDKSYSYSSFIRVIKNHGVERAMRGKRTSETYSVRGEMLTIGEISKKYEIPRSTLATWKRKKIIDEKLKEY